MFFKAFNSNGRSPLPVLLTYTVEYQASRVLAEGDTTFLRKTVEDHTLPETLFWEVEFFGDIPRHMREKVRRYFYAKEKTLYSVARRLLKEPDNTTFRDELMQPVIPQNEIDRMLEIA